MIWVFEVSGADGSAPYIAARGANRQDAMNRAMKHAPDGASLTEVKFLEGAEARAMLDRMGNQTVAPLDQL